MDVYGGGGGGGGGRAPGPGWVASGLMCEAISTRRNRQFIAVKCIGKMRIVAPRGQQPHTHTHTHSHTHTTLGAGRGGSKQRSRDAPNGPGVSFCAKKTFFLFWKSTDAAFQWANDRKSTECFFSITSRSRLLQLSAYVQHLAFQKFQEIDTNNS